MKKAKVLIPAIAVLALSAASAVTGTVAWFQASRTATTSAEKITVVNAEASLNVTATAAALKAEGTSVKSNTDNHPVITHETLRDGSVDVLNGKVYGAKLNDDGTVGAAPTSFVDYTSDFGVKTVNGKDVYRASKYTLTFSMASDIAQGDVYGLFLDGSTAKTKVVESETANDTILQALRIGFKCGAEWTVIAPSANKTLAATTDKYVNNTKAAATSYVAENVAAERTISTYDKTSPNFLGDIKKPDAEINTLAVEVWTWFEGSDETCTNENVEKLLNTEGWSLTIGFNLLKDQSSLAQ